MVNVTVEPESFIILTMSPCDKLVIFVLLTASTWSPKWIWPSLKAGLPSIIRPITLYKTQMHFNVYNIYKTHFKNYDLPIVGPLFNEEITTNPNPSLSFLVNVTS